MQRSHGGNRARNPRVLHLLERVGRGGMEILVLDLARAAAGAGIDMEVCAAGEGALREEFLALGARFHDLRRRAPIDLREVRLLRARLCQGRFDVVHAHQPVTALHAWLATRGTGIPCVLTIHGYSPHVRKDAAALSFVLTRLERRVTVSRAFLDRLRRELPAARKTEFAIVYNGIDVRRFAHAGPDLRPGPDLRQELGLPREARLLGMVGNFQRAKDQATICRALPHVLARVPEARFVFVGAPSHRPSYEACVDWCASHGLAERVRFLGARSDVPAVLRSLDLFVFSSLEDSFGLAVLEAMEAGAPCLVSDIPSLVEITGDAGTEAAGGAAARHFRAGDADDLAANILSLLDDAAERDRLIAAGRKLVRARFTMEAHAEALAALYRAVAGLPARGASG